MNISTDHVHPKQKSSVKSARSADCRHEPDDWRRGGHPLRHAWHGAGPEAWRTDRGQVEGRYGLRFMYIYILCWKIYVFRLCRDMVFQSYSSVFQKRQATHQRFFFNVFWRFLSWSLDTTKPASSPSGELWGEQRGTGEEFERPKFRDPTRQRTARRPGQPGRNLGESWYTGTGIYVYSIYIVYIYIYIYDFIWIIIIYINVKWLLDRYMQIAYSHRSRFTWIMIVLNMQTTCIIKEHFQ